MIVDEKVVKNDPVDWWSKPSEFVGTGAYKMTEYIPHQDMKFVAVPNWWGTPKPALTNVNVDIKASDTATQSTAIAAWEQGKYDLLGYGGSSSLPIADILRIHQFEQRVEPAQAHPQGAHHLGDVHGQRELQPDHRRR